MTACHFPQLGSRFTNSTCYRRSEVQVYKAKLRANEATVAVKVPRPAALETVALDRSICQYLGQSSNDVRVCLPASARPPLEEGSSSCKFGQLRTFLWV